MKNKIISSFKFIIPILLWLFLFSDAVSGKIPVSGDCLSFYSHVKYFFDSLQVGVFSLWCPFIFWGGTFLVELNAYGVFNPIWLLIPLLNKLGLSFYLSFLSAFIGYFFVGQIGFYFLAKTVLRSSLAAYAAFLFFLFSSSGMFIFHYPYHIFIFVSVIWFFYFLLNFWQCPKRRFFVGTIFSLMLILNCYLPFYWLTIFVFFSVVYFLFNFMRFKKDILIIKSFFCRHFLTVIFCFLALFLSAISSFKTYQLTKTGEIVCNERKTKEESPYAGGAEVSYGKIVNAGPSTESFTGSLFLDRDKVLPASITFFYISFFAWCILALSIFNKIRKKTVFLILLILPLFFILIGEQSFVFKVFFNFIPWFSFIRNIGIFVFILLPIFILFLALQLKLILKEKFLINRYYALAVVAVVHVGILMLLIGKNSFFSTYATVLLSLIFFSIIILEYQVRKWLWFILLGLCIVAQPVEVMWRFRDNLKNVIIKDRANYFKIIAQPSSRIIFSFIRPDYEENYSNLESFEHRVQLKDLMKFPPGGAGFPPKWSYYLVENISTEILNKYIKYKFYLYDHIEIVNHENESLDFLIKIFQNNTNLALVSGDEAQAQGLRFKSLLSDDNTRIQSQATVISSPSDSFEVLGFNANSIKIRTHFSKEKFLVYTDSFQSDWQVFVNGKRAPLYRSNFAFKGVELPPGENIVYFRYFPIGGELVYLLIFGIYIGLFLWLIILFINDDKAKKEILRND
ncbi:MAG: hypothetical protein PHY73_02145 [Candidatus Omnitrophica bacterium]|nr:hypothetical protein [Candidatus Omnitrophota bacterium]